MRMAPGRVQKAHRGLGLKTVFPSSLHSEQNFHTNPSAYTKPNKAVRHTMTQAANGKWTCTGSFESASFENALENVVLKR